MATRKRWTNFGTGRDRTPTHDDTFRNAFKRQKRAAAGEVDLVVLAEVDVESLSSYGKKQHAAKIALSLDNIEEADAHSEDATTLEFIEVEVVEINTVSGLRRVWIDKLDAWKALGVVIEDDNVEDDNEGDEEIDNE